MINLYTNIANPLDSNSRKITVLNNTSMIISLMDSAGIVFHSYPCTDAKAVFDKGKGLYIYETFSIDYRDNPALDNHLESVVRNKGIHGEQAVRHASVCLEARRRRNRGDYPPETVTIDTFICSSYLTKTGPLSALTSHYFPSLGLTISSSGIPKENPVYKSVRTGSRFNPFEYPKGNNNSVTFNLVYVNQQGKRLKKYWVIKDEYLVLEPVEKKGAKDGLYVVINDPACVNKPKAIYLGDTSEELERHGFFSDKIKADDYHDVTGRLDYEKRLLERRILELKTLQANEDYRLTTEKERIKLEEERKRNIQELEYRRRKAEIDIELGKNKLANAEAIHRLEEEKREKETTTGYLENGYILSKIMAHLATTSKTLRKG